MASIPRSDTPPPLLELVNATVIKQGRKALDGLTLTIRRGAHTAVVGPNGSGKSTLMNLLTLEDRPLAVPGAAVRVCGIDRWNVFELRAKLGILSADLHHRFVNGNSAGRVVAADAVLSGLLTTFGWVRPEETTDAMRERAAAALTRLGVIHLAGTPLNEMSTGEARRVLIARALINDPEVLVLDEPTTGLDLVARGRFLDAVREVARQGTTIVIVTHRLEEIVPEIADVVLLNRGRVVAAGPKAETLTSANLSAIFEAAVDLVEAGGTYSARVTEPWPGRVLA
jgi:iron complex transport system ATP-binding protein